MLSTDLLAYYRRISQSQFTVVDVETTGHRPPLSRVIEVSVLQATLADGILQQQTHLLNPQVLVPPSITQFTGITQEMVDQAPYSADVWYQYLPLLQDGILTAHNLAFDYSFLQSEFNYVDRIFERSAESQLCTVLLARQLLPDLPSRSLPNLVEHFGFDVGRSHRAAADTLACWMLAERLLTEIQAETDEDLLSRFANEWIPLKQAAAILDVTSRAARPLLTAAEIEPRLVGHYRTPMYRRGDVEQLYWERSPQIQLSWL